MEELAVYLLLCLVGVISWFHFMLVMDFLYLEMRNSSNKTLLRQKNRHLMVFAYHAYKSLLSKLQYLEIRKTIDARFFREGVYIDFEVMKCISCCYVQLDVISSFDILVAHLSHYFAAKSCTLQNIAYGFSKY